MKDKITGFVFGVLLAVGCAVIAQEWYEATGVPRQRSAVSSADLRNEFAAIESDIADKLPALTGNGGKVVAINSAGTALEAVDDVPVGAGAIDNSELRDSAGVSVIGRSANTTGDVADIAAGSNDTVLRRTSDALSFGQLTAGMFPATVVPDAALSANVPVIETGSFSLSEVGLTGTPTATVDYIKIGDIVMLAFTAGFLAESDGVGLTMSSLPAALRPVGNNRWNPVLLVDNGEQRIGSVIITGAGGLTFAIEQAAGDDTINNDSFTGSGNKGLSAGTIITYPL